MNSVLTFILKSGIEVTFKVDEIIRYDFDDLQILYDFCRVRAYHGNVGDVLHGKHGFNLCPVAIRDTFHGTLTLEQRRYILQCKIHTGDYGGLSVNERQIVNDYLQWREKGTETLFRCVCLVFEDLFCHYEIIRVPIGIDYTRCDSLLTILISLQTKRRNAKAPTLNIAKYTEDAKPKKLIPLKNPTTYILDCMNYIDAVKAHGVHLKKRFTFTACGKNAAGVVTQMVLFHQFLKTMKIRKKLQYIYQKAFTMFAIPWLVHKYFTMTEKDERTMDDYIERNVQDWEIN